MTHDELIKEINTVLYPWWMQDALRAIVELHKSVEQTTGMSYTQENGLQVLATQAICVFCRDTGVIDYSYPCPTIQAIEKELL